MVMICIVGASAFLVLALSSALMHVLGVMERSLSDHTETLPGFTPVDQPSPSRHLPQALGCKEFISSVIASSTMPASLSGAAFSTCQVSTIPFGAVLTASP